MVCLVFKGNGIKEFRDDFFYIQSACQSMGTRNASQDPLHLHQNSPGPICQANFHN